MSSVNRGPDAHHGHCSWFSVVGRGDFVRLRSWIIVVLRFRISMRVRRANKGLRVQHSTVIISPKYMNLASFDNVRCRMVVARAGYLFKNERNSAIASCGSSHGIVTRWKRCGSVMRRHCFETLEQGFRLPGLRMIFLNSPIIFSTSSSGRRASSELI